MIFTFATVADCSLPIAYAGPTHGIFNFCIGTPPTIQIEVGYQPTIFHVELELEGKMSFVTVSFLEATGP
jgi:hypothetical protein